MCALLRNPACPSGGVDTTDPQLDRTRSICLSRSVPRSVRAGDHLSLLCDEDERDTAGRTREARSGDGRPCIVREGRAGCTMKGRRVWRRVPPSVFYRPPDVPLQGGQRQGEVLLQPVSRLICRLEDNEEKPGGRFSNARAGGIG